MDYIRQFTPLKIQSKIGRTTFNASFTELIFSKATVQIGNAQREAAGSAAQSLIARSATQELREELGEQLLPAAGEILRTFNEIRTDATPALIDRFSDLNLQVLGVVKTFNDLRDVLTFTNDEQLELSDITANRLTGGFKALGLALKAQGIVAKGDIIVKQRQAEILADLDQHFKDTTKNTDALSRSLQGNRTQTNINRVAQDKYQSLLIRYN